MSETVIRRCDFKIQEKRKYRACGERVPGDKPVFIAAGQDVYELDLCEQHQLRLEEALVPFLDIAGEASTSVGKAIRKALLSLGGEPTQTEMRVWLKENGYDVAPTGQLRKDAVAIYKEAHA